MASTLAPGATVEDIENELAFQQAMLESLDESEVDEDHPTRSKIEKELEALEVLLQQALNSPASSATGRNTSPDTEASSLSNSESSLHAGPKRPGELFTNDRPTKKHTPEPPYPSATSFRRYPSIKSSRGRDSAFERRKMAEEAAMRRYEAQQADARFAASLDQSGRFDPAQPGPSRQFHTQTFGTPSSLAPIFRPPGISSTPGPASSRSITTQPSPSPFANVVDLTGDDDNITYPFQRAPYPYNQIKQDPETLRLENHKRDIMAQHNAMDNRKHVYRDEFVRRQHEAEARRQMKEQSRRAAGHVYGMYGGYGGSAYPSSSFQAPPTTMQSLYEPIKRSLANVGRSIAHWDGDLKPLESLINGRASDGDGDEVPWYAAPHNYDEAVDPEQVAEDLRNLMDNIRPEDEMPADEQDVEVESMTVALKPYQGTGLKWLQDMENGTNKGGILADDMGLGKTVQAIALMTTQRSEDPLCRTTLIIAPVALLRQWREEIMTKLKRGRHAMSVFIHHSTTKKKSFAELRQYDVILTTFGTLAAEQRKHEKYLARKDADSQAVERADEKCLFTGENAHWYRVIVDEAQNMKNRLTKAAKAAYRLKAKSRICMTGTPMMNSVDELFSLIHFIGIRPYNNWQRFALDFSKPLKRSNEDSRAAAMSKLQALLKAVLLRRHKKTKINGRPILILPERTIEATNPVFSEEEKDFYVALETQSRINFNKFVAAGTVGRSYAHILLMLLRLRQACCHPHLIKDFGVAAAAEISPETMVELAKTLDDAVIKRIIEHEGAFECPVCYDAVENPAIFVPCGHDTCSECFAKIAEAANAEDGQTPKCPNCRALVNAKTVIDYETFKTVHMPVLALPEEELDPAEAETESEADETDASDDESEDDSDDSDDMKDFIVDDDAETESEAEGDDEKTAKGEDGDDLDVKTTTMTAPNGAESVVEGSAPARRSRKAKGKRPRGLIDDDAEGAEASEPQARRKGKAKSKGTGKKREKKPKKVRKANDPKTLAELKKLATRNKAAKREYLKLIRRDFVGSAKVDRTMELLNQIITETDEKVIVFSQWTSLLDLLEIPIDDKRWGYQRYDGSMTAKARGEAVDDFKSNPRIRLMIVSLKAGNAGLNLNCASQVIILDPFWNPYIEEQAIDRAHRLGQTREVKVNRVLIPDTVEDRIIALQEKKRSMINEALDEGAGQRLSRLSPQELGYLFGITRSPNAPLPAP